MGVDNPQEASYNGVSVDHPSIVAAIQNIKKSTGSKEQAMKITGMPIQVVEKHWK